MDLDAMNKNLAEKTRHFNDGLESGWEYAKEQRKQHGLEDDLGILSIIENLTAYRKDAARSVRKLRDGSETWCYYRGLRSALDQEIRYAEFRLELLND